MLLYDSPNPAPNPRRVRMFLAEKGISVPTTVLAIREGDHKQPAFLAINPMGQIPALVLDDGDVITESIAICRYFEAAHPAPPLFGEGAKGVAQVDMALRRVEFRLMTALGMIWMHTHPFTARVVKPQFTEFGESNRPRALAVLAELDQTLTDRPFLAGSDYSIADIVLFSGLEFGRLIDVAVPSGLTHLTDWYERVAARPSALA